MAATFTLTGTLFHQDNVTPAANAGIKVKAAPYPDPAIKVYYTHGVTFSTDANGHFSRNLVTEPGLVYTIRSTAKHPAFHPITFAAPAEGATLDISTLTSYVPGDPPLLTQLQTYATSAFNSATAAAASAASVDPTQMIHYAPPPVGGTSDDLASLNSAVSSLGALGGTLYLRAGTYLLSDTLTLPTKVVLRGVGRSATILKAHSTFATGKALTALGSNSVLAFGTRLENLTVDCNNVATSRCVMSPSVNELSGVRDCVLTNFTQYGVHFENFAGDTTNPSGVVLEGLELYPASTGATYGIYLKDVAITNRISRVTAGVQGTLTAGIFIDSSHVVIDDVHVERCTDGINVASGQVDIRGISGFSNTTTVVRTASRSVHAESIRANGSTNLVVDTFNGVTVPATVNSAQTLAEYNAGDHMVGSARFAPSGASSADMFGSLRGWNSAGVMTYATRITGDTNDRFYVNADGQLQWGPGNAGSDVILYRPAANTLRTNTSFRAEQGIGVFGSAAPGSRPTVTGSRGGNAALASLLTALASYGLITDSTTA